MCIILHEFQYRIQSESFKPIKHYYGLKGHREKIEIVTQGNTDCRFIKVVISMYVDKYFSSDIDISTPLFHNVN